MEHKIILACSPPHSTHVYQAPDVGVFGVLKTYWGEVCRRWSEMHVEQIGKTNFLEIYGHAHKLAFTITNIQSAWRKAGIVPFDRSVVTPKMLAPAISSSMHVYLSSNQLSPMRKLHAIFFPKSTLSTVEEVSGVACCHCPLPPNMQSWIQTLIPYCNPLACVRGLLGHSLRPHIHIWYPTHQHTALQGTSL